MRLIILILILINVAFFYWASTHNFNEVVLSEPELVDNYQPIKLLTEIELQSSNEDTVEAPNSVQGALKNLVTRNKKTNKCFSFGPFETKQASDQLYKELFSLGIPSKQRMVNEREPKSYWVYLPAYESQQKAETVTEFLEQNKISEYHIWLDSPHKYAVSLGLFSKLNTARDKMAEIEKLDLKPEMEVRFKEITEHWVDFEHSQEELHPEIVEEILRKNDRMLILETKCL